jgi:hypothetical protein
MRRHIILGFQFGRQFRHRDIRLRLDPLEQSRQMRRQFTSPRRTTLPRWPGRTRPRYQIRQLYCKACADIVPPRRRPARLTAIDLRLNPFPKINRIRLPHPCWPPSLPASILNQTSDSLGIPFRFLFHARRSSVSLSIARKSGSSSTTTALCERPADGRWTTSFWSNDKTLPSRRGTNLASGIGRPKK